MYKNALFLTGFIFAGLTGCSSDESSSAATASTKEKSVAVVSDTKENGLLTVSNVLRVSDYDFTLGGKPAVSIASGPKDKEYFKITLQRENIKTGYEINSRMRSYKLASAEAKWGGVYYVESNKHDTYFRMKILSFDPATKRAEVEFSAKLVSPSKDKYITLSQSKLLISEQYFQNLAAR